jgi:thioredoxin-related protein
MILLFTSEHCTWCDMVRNMIENECYNLEQEFPIYEVCIEECQQIAQAYGILTVPTLIAGNNMLTGVPGHADLRSFLLQAAAGCRIHHKKDQTRLLSNLVRRRKIASYHEKESTETQTIPQ